MWAVLLTLFVIYITHRTSDMNIELTMAESWLFYI